MDSSADALEAALDLEWENPFQSLRFHKDIKLVNGCLNDHGLGHALFCLPHISPSRLYAPPNQADNDLVSLLTHKEPDWPAEWEEREDLKMCTTPQLVRPLLKRLSGPGPNGWSLSNASRFGRLRDFAEPAEWIVGTVPAMFPAG